MAPAKRVNVLVGGVATVMLLAGCASESDPQSRQAPLPAATEAPDTATAESGEELTPQSTPQALVFKSGVLEIGDFDPYTLGGNIFDPCTEITPEEFAAAGFDHVEPLPEEYAGLARASAACEVFDEEGFLVGTLLNNDANRAHIEKKFKVQGVTDSLLPAVFTYQPSTDLGVGCFAQIDTLRGGLSVSVAGLRGFNTSEESCSTAVSMLESLQLDAKF